MLFDLRGRGRRRTVRVIYTGLAILMGGGLVLFGVGSFGGTGILNNVGNESASSASYAGQIKKYQALTRQQPRNPSAWEKLTEAQLHEAGGEAYVTSTGAVTSKGKELFAQTAQSWNSYLALNPPKPSYKLAQLMLPVFSAEGLNKPSEEVQILQIIVAAKPHNAADFAHLAEYAYLAHNTRLGDLAAKQAVALSPPNERPRVQGELAALKKSPGGGETLTGTTNGKTYTVKGGSGGTYTGTVPSGTVSIPAPTPTP
jgi:hypothetical protein